MIRILVIFSDNVWQFVPIDYYNVQQWYLFKGGVELCIPKASLREQLLQEMHSSGLTAHTVERKLWVCLLRGSTGHTLREMYVLDFFNVWHLSICLESHTEH